MFKGLKISHKLLGAYGFLVALFFIILLLIYSIFLNFLTASLEQSSYNRLDDITTANYNKIEVNVNSSVKTYLRAISEKNRDFVSKNYQLVQTKVLSEEQARERIRELLLTQIIGKDGYSYILNSDHELVIHPDKRLEGQKMSEDAAIRGMVNLKKGFYEYLWQSREKIVYLEYFEPWDYIIGISAYVEDLMYLVDKEKLLEEMANVKIGKSGSLLIIDLEGNVILAQDRTIEGSNIFNTKDRDGKYFARDIVNMREGSYEYTWKERNDLEFKERIVVFKYLKEVGWIIGARILKEELYEGTQTIKTFFRLSLVGIVMLIIIASFLLTIFIRRSINQPLSLLNEIKTIEGDLTRRLPQTASGELGEVVVHFNNFLTLINKTIDNVKKSITKSREMGSELKGRAEESLTFLEEIRNFITVLDEKAKELDSEIKSVKESTREVNGFALLVESELSSQAEEFSRASSSIEEMNASITNVARISEDRLAVVVGLEKIALEGQKEMDETLKVIKVVTSSSQVIMDMLKVINKIASETGLLAMNAAIEAAHAGDAGRGFAIVAAEIRRLSVEAGSNAKEITKSLKEIITYIQSSEKSSARTDRYFKDIVFEIKEVAGAMAEIKESMKELSIGSSLIVEALEVIVDKSKKIDEKAGSMTRQTENIAGSLQSIAHISSDNRKGMENIGRLADKVAQSGERINRAVNENSRSIEETKGLVDRLKTMDESEHRD